MGTIDEQRWPAIATVPQGSRLRRKARRAESDFAYACEQSGIKLIGETPDLQVLEDALFLRIADVGWLGLAESFMAGEWHSSDLAGVLQGLISAGYNPKASGFTPGLFDARATPSDLLRLTSGDALFGPATVFSSGVPTTERTILAAPSRIKTATPISVDVTTLSDPTVVERADLNDAQARAIDVLFDLADVGTGTYVADLPAYSPALAAMAHARRATVDVMAHDPELLEELAKLAAKADGSVQVVTLPDVLPDPGKTRRKYDACVSVHALEAMDPASLRQMLAVSERCLVHGGRFVAQTLVGTEALKTTPGVLAPLQAYVQPGMRLRSVDELLHAVRATPGLRPTEVLHVGGHYVEGLRLQREYFEAHEREAAALGFDAVYRRLWVFQLALQEALLRAGACDAVMVAATAQHRH